MGAEFHRVVMVALAAGLLVIPGCSAGDGTSTGKVADPPAVTAPQTTIVDAQLEGNSSLRVTFSEGVKPLVGVDPAKFRLTVAYFTRPASASNKYSYKYYAGTYKNGSYYGGNDQTVYSDIGDLASVTSDPTTTDQAVLQLGSTFSAATACQQIAAFNAANSNAHAGLYLHYSSAGTPTIEDLQGNKVASLAAYWSTDPTVEQINGDFTGKPIPVALTCP